MHSLMSMFHEHTEEMEKENNSIVEVRDILHSVHTVLQERKGNNFMPIKVKELLAQKHKDGHQAVAVTISVLMCKVSIPVWL